MEDLILYLLKSAALLSIFYGVYQLLLRNDTSFQANRHFLLLGILTAAVLPAIVITRTVEIPVTFAENTLPLATGSSDLPQPAAIEIDWWQMAGMLYALIALGLLLRMLIQLISLSLIIRGGTVTREDGFNVIETTKSLNPFSFFHHIVLNPEMHAEEDLQNILEHEKTHAFQWHSVDVLVANLTCALLWFNPLSWLYRKALVQNLEFIADRKSVTAVPREKYQHTLVKLAVSMHQPVLANNFYQSLIKKRIVMLNKQPTSTRSYWKFGAIIPLLLVFMLACNVKTEAQVKSDVTSISVTVTKESTDESLENLVSFFNTNGIKLDFQDLKRNSEGIITNITAHAQSKKDPEEKGWFKLNDADGIKTFQVTVKEGKIAFNDQVTAPDPKLSDFLAPLGEQPLFFINQKEYTSKELKGKVVLISGEATTLMGEGREKYGAKAKDGVIFIPNGEIKEYEAAFKELDSAGDDELRRYIWITGETKPLYMTAGKKISVTSSDIIPDSENINASQTTAKAVSYSYQEDPLIVVNGKVMQKGFDVNSIDTDSIATINVLNGGAAVSVYGSEAGKRGAVVIVTKNATEQSSANGVVVTKIGEDSYSMEFSGENEMNFPKEGVLYIVNGKEMDKSFDPDSINPEDILTVNVLKNESATGKYGKKARNGVIDIKTKE